MCVEEKFEKVFSERLSVIFDGCACVGPHPTGVVVTSADVFFVIREGFSWKLDFGV